MTKETGTLHYLNKGETETPPVTPPTPSPYDELIGQVKNRLDQIEKEFRDKFKRLESQEKVKKTSPPLDISSLVQLLEERIQKVTDEIVSKNFQKNKGQMKIVFDGLQKMRQLINGTEFKSFLSSLWFGRKEENGEIDPFGMDPAFIKRVKPFFDFLYYNYWRVSVEGLPHIPSEGRGLIVANHSGTLPYDGAMIGAAIVNDHHSRRDVRFLVEDFVYHFPFLGTLMYRIGGVRACPENAERLLAKNHLVTVFPEGVKGIGKHYKNRYRLQRFGRGGFVKLALKTNAPIIPTAVIGAEEIHPILLKSTLLARPFGIPYIPVTPTLPLLGIFGFIPLPSKWTIIFGEPIHFGPTYGPKDAEDQLLVNRLSETVRGKIQEMIVEALRNRRSVWFG